MLKKGLLLSIIFVLIFSVCGYALDYTYTQESGAGFFVGTADKSDALEDTNEVRQIVNDLGTLLQHSKMDGSYPADATTGGTLEVFADYYLKTEVDTLSEMEAIWITDVTDSTELATALSDYYLKTAINTLDKVEAIYGVDVTTSTELATYCETTQDYLKTSENSDSDDDVSDDSIGDLGDVDLTDIADGKILKYNISTSKFECESESGGGYTNLTSFVDQTAFRLFYSDGSGDVTELALGADNTYLMSNGADQAPTFEAAGGGASQLSDLTDVGVTTKTDKFVLVADGDSFESRALVEADISDLGAYITDVVDDTTPEYGGPVDHNNYRDTEVKTVEFDGLYDNGSSGATPTINWQNGNYQRIAVSEDALLTFSNAFIGTITLQITYSGAYTMGFNAGYTLLEEGGTELSFTETSAAVDILKVMYLGTASTYVVGLLADVKD